LGPLRPDRRALAVRALDSEIDSVIRAYGTDLAVGLWIGGPTGGAWYERNSDVSYPTASAIKTAYLLELFAAYAHALDAPLPGLDRLLGRDGHPCLAPFSRAQRDDIRHALRGASARKIGRIMMAKTRAANHVYNAAANVATAILGGPAELSRRIRARDPAFAPATVRRYMLADRRPRGENTATAASLAAVLQRLASHRAPGLTHRLVAAAREAMKTTRDRRGGRIYVKTGYLPPHPIIRVWSGWRESGHGSTVCVVMTCQPSRGRRARRRSTDQLVAIVARLRNILLGSARQISAPAHHRRLESSQPHRDSNSHLSPSTYRRLF